MTGRQRLVAGIAALLLLVGGGAWWWLRDGRSPGDQAASPGAQPGQPGRVARHRLPGVSGWLGQLGLEPRRVAGRVTYRGAPVTGATVRLELARELRRAAPPVEVSTGADGAFDFGPRVAAEFLVLASAPGRAPDGARVDLRDPTRSPPPDRIELVLTDCGHTVYGLVHDHGSPIAGAAVRAATGEDSLAIATTGEDGNYLVCVGPGGGTMTVEAEGYASATLEFDGRKRIRRDVELTPEALVTGVVLGPGDRPAAGALVTARPSERILFAPQKWSAVADGDGHFSLGGLAPGRYLLAARDAGQRTSDEVEAVAVVGGGEEVTLHLVQMVTVRGTIVEDGKPVAGARVVHRTGQFLRAGPSFAPYAHAVSQSDGSFVLDAVPPGEFSIAVDEYEVLEPASATAVLPETEVLVKVASKASVAGRVTSAGNPVAGATLRMIGTDRSWGGWARTKPDGVFELRGVEPGSYEIRAQSESGFARGVPITVARGQHIDGVNIELDLAGEISGIVVDQRGAPVAGVAVVFELEPKVDFGFATTEEDGTFVAGAMSGGGTYSVTVRANRGSPVALEPAPGTSFPTVSLTDGRSRATDIRLVVKLERGQISGVVVSGDGKPVADAKVSAFPPLDSDFMMRFTPPAAEVTTDPDGSFALRDLVAGAYTVRARTGAGAEAIASKVPAGRKDLRLTLPSTGAIEGELVGFGPKARVSATRVDLGALDDFAGRVHGSRFTIAQVPPGSYMVSAREGAGAARTTVEVAAGTTARVTLTSKGTATVNGRAVDLLTREPLAGLECSDDAWDDRAHRTRTDAQGRFTLEVPAGRPIEVDCAGPRARSLTSGSATVVLEPGTTRQIQVEVIVKRKAGRVPGDLGLHLQPGPPALVYKVDPDGPAERAGVQAGDRVLKVDGADVSALASHPVVMLMLDHAIGEKVELVLDRDGREVQASVELVERQPGR